MSAEHKSALSHSSAITTTVPIRTRRRSRKACIPCRQRKRKCDGNDPCATCLGYGYNCRYNDEHHDSTITQLKPTNNARHIVDSPTSTIHDYPTRSSISDIGAKKNDEYKTAVLDPYKSRFMKANSAIAFPRSLGIELNSSDPPRLHSFAWNSGIRPETKNNVQPKIRSLLSYEEVQKYSRKYFETIQPIYAFLDREIYEGKCLTHWNDNLQGLEFEAIIAGVVTLGSFFSHPDENVQLETDLLHHAKSVLESTSMFGNARVEHIMAWILRTIYLRSTHRPHASWMSSCLTMHLVESIGLHQEFDTVDIASPNAAPLLEVKEIEMRRRLFWTSWSINRVLSYEYGRSPVYMINIGTKLPTSEGPEDFMVQFVSLARSLPDDENERNLCKVQIFRALEEMEKVNGNFHEIQLLKADLAFCLYRRLRIQDEGYPKGCLSQIIKHGRVAMNPACILANSNLPWWNIISTPFQFICVLLAIDSMDSLAFVAEAYMALKTVVRHFNTHLAMEALQTAEKLIQLSRQNKTKEVDFLSLIDNDQIGRKVDANSPHETLYDAGDIAMAEGLADAIDWDDFLNPTYMFS